MSKKKEVSRTKELEVMNPNAASIDIGSKVHYVCVLEDRDSEHVKSFESFTENLNEMAN